MQRYVNDVKADISREMELEELRKLQSTVESAAQSIQEDVNREVRETGAGLEQVAKDATDIATKSAADYPELPAAEATPAPSQQAGAQQQLDLTLDAGTPQQKQG